MKTFTPSQSPNRPDSASYHSGEAYEASQSSYHKKSDVPLPSSKTLGQAFFVGGRENTVLTTEDKADFPRDAVLDTEPGEKIAVAVKPPPNLFSADEVAGQGGPTCVCRCCDFF